jgi:hypothetical protein
MRLMTFSFLGEISERSRPIAGGNCPPSSILLDADCTRRIEEVWGIACEAQS